MLNKIDIESVMKDAANINSFDVGSINEILDLYQKRKYKEVSQFLIPIQIRPKKERASWWLSIVSLWLGYLKNQGFNFEENTKFLIAKNKQYGSKQLYLLDTLGIWLRSIDKVERIQTIDSGVQTSLISNESRMDSVLDLFNYSMLAVLIIRKRVY